jgi:hypothetical protein
MTPENWYLSSISANRQNDVSASTFAAAHLGRNPYPRITTGPSWGREDRRREPRFVVNESAWLRVLDPPSDRIKATVVNISRSGMKLRLPVLIHVGKAVQVHLEFAIALGEVRHSEAFKADCVAGLLLRDVCPLGSGRDARQEVRYPVNILGSLRVRGSRNVSYEINVLDVSKSGLRIRIGEDIPVGTQVDIDCSGSRISGEIRYLRAVDSGEFNIGIRAHAANRDEGTDDALDLTRIFYPDIESCAVPC